MIPRAWPVLHTNQSLMQKKRRLDEVCCELAPEHSRKVIQGFILAGKVFVNDEKVTKAGHQVSTRDCHFLQTAVAEDPYWSCKRHGMFQCVSGFWVA